MRKILSGNQALGLAALAAGVDVAAGYPGTPSTESLAEILKYSQNNDTAPWVEWSVNEKVAFDVATGAAWAGQRALSTMKMSGLNVALDSVMSVAYSGTTGGFVLYVSDDPGAEAGMPEQDSRILTMAAGLPMLEPGSVQEVYDLTIEAFELSEKVGTPVIVRLVTSVAHGQAEVEGSFDYKPRNTAAQHSRDITKFTKAGSKICLDQHTELLGRLDQCAEIYNGSGWNRLSIQEKGSAGIISSGVINEYLSEIINVYPEVSTLLMTAIYPIDRKSVLSLLEANQIILILEELDPAIEMQIRSLAGTIGWQGKILGKMDGTLPMVGRYSLNEIEKGICAALGKEYSEPVKKESPEYKHPITFCSGCPHRGTYMALNSGIKKAGYKKQDVLVTGDIGCTILGMGYPFDSCSTEVSMGSSIGLAQGFARAGIETPVVATIGDSTFFHAGIPPLINAVQQNTDILVIILDNGWTSMTGFQINPGTDENQQLDNRRHVDKDQIIRAIGVDHFEIIKPFDQVSASESIAKALKMKGVRVLISREECVLTKDRREKIKTVLSVDPEKCTYCKMCLKVSGCPALEPENSGEKTVMSIDPGLCKGCGLCESVCKFDAFIKGEK